LFGLEVPGLPLTLAGNSESRMKSVLFTISVLLAATPTILTAQVRGKVLEKIESCTMIPTDWADGDSFLIKTGTGDQHTIRLYGVDCLEMHVRDDSDATRLRAQRRYFGISEVGDSPQASIALAKEYGKLAKAETATALAQPFTIHTSFADARGDAKFKRIYAFVRTADGEDLGERLVRLGLARAFGVYRETPDGQHRDVYKERLRDLELVASRRESGIWAKTDWDKLPEERQLQRTENAELDLALEQEETPPASKLDLNTAARDELMKIPDVGEKTANSIIEGRPYATIDELDKVAGIGQKTLEKLKDYVRIVDQQGDLAQPLP